MYLFIMPTTAPIAGTEDILLISSGCKLLNLVTILEIEAKSESLKLPTFVGLEERYIKRLSESLAFPLVPIYPT